MLRASPACICGSPTDMADRLLPGALQGYAPVVASEPAPGSDHVSGRMSKRSLTPAMSRSRRTFAFGTRINRRPEGVVSWETSTRLRRPTEPKKASPRRSTTTAPSPRSRPARIAAFASSTEARSSSPSSATVTSPPSSLTWALKRSPESLPVGIGREPSGEPHRRPRMPVAAHCDEPMTTGGRLPERGAARPPDRRYGRCGPRRRRRIEGSSPGPRRASPGASSPVAPWRPGDGGLVHEPVEGGGVPVDALLGDEAAFQPVDADARELDQTAARSEPGDVSRVVASVGPLERRGPLPLFKPTYVEDAVGHRRHVRLRLGRDRVATVQTRPWLGVLHSNAVGRERSRHLLAVPRVPPLDERLHGHLAPFVPRMARPT